MMYCVECDQWVKELHHVSDVHYEYEEGIPYLEEEWCDGQSGKLIFSCPPPVNFPDDWNDVELMYEEMVGEEYYE